MDKLVCMLELQQQLNDSTNGIGWEKGVTKEGKTIDWRRCIYMEAAEMIDSFGWKHWKSIAQPTDYANLQIEIVDVWHFVMSLVLELEYPQEGNSIEAIARRMVESDGYRRIDSDNVPAFSPDNILMEQIESVMRNALQPRDQNDLDALSNDFFTLSSMGGLNLDQLYRLYVGKNILNRFRQDHGYKEGTYVKVWNGMEDNAVMKEAWEENPDMTPDELYRALEGHYPA